jgi:predicted amidohydrolase
MKFAPTIKGNLEKIDAAIADAAGRQVDIVLLPETATTGYCFDFAALKPQALGDAVRAVGQIAARHKINVLVGTAMFKGSRLYNCLVAFDRAGRPVHCYAKNQLTPDDTKVFAPGNAIALFTLDGVTVTTVICHERRYPELVRLAVMAGAQILFHPNAGLDAWNVSEAKRNGRDGVVARAFENAIYYVFANSVGPQASGKWSAGDSKIVAPDETVLALADNENEAVIAADLDLSLADRRYAVRSMQRPAFLRADWKAMVAKVKRQARESSRSFLAELRSRR